MDSPSLATLERLSLGQKATLKRVNILTVADIILLSPSDLVKKCRISHHEAQEIINTVCDELAPKLYTFYHEDLPKDETFTTGDALVDRVLGGGIRVGKLWEVVGESAAGKTQFAMQLSLAVQLPSSLGGISGAACFLSTSWTLPTNRLLEMIDAHPLLSPDICGLADIHTLKTPTIPMLRHVLSDTLPAFIEQLASRRDAKPVKLVILDALTELFHSDDKYSYTTLADRSKHLSEISTLLHTIASKHGIAIIAVNEVVASIERDPPPDAKPHEVIYRDQARWFNRADSIPGEDAREAAMGLVWANQVNARVMLSRTRRMHYPETQVHKRPRLGTDADVSSTRIAGENGQPVRLRRMTVIFNSVAPPGSVDYIVTAGGIVAIPGEDAAQSTFERASPPRKTPAPPPTAIAEASSDLTDPLASSQLTLDEFALATDDTNATSDVADAAENGPLEEEDEWDAYWKDDDLGSDVYSQVDLDALSSTHPA